MKKARPPESFRRAQNVPGNKRTSEDMILEFIRTGRTFPYTDPEIRELLALFDFPSRFIGVPQTFISPEVLGQMQPFFDGRSLFIYGAKGRGKTTCCAFLMEEYFRRNPFRCNEERKTFIPTVKFIDSQNFADLIQGVKDNLRQPYEMDPETEIMKRRPIPDDIIEEYSHYGILFLDDLGRVPSQELRSVISNRYNNSRQTVFTSNFSLTELEDVKMLGEYLPTRINEMSSVINLKGPDHRLESKIKNIPMEEKNASE